MSFYIKENSSREYHSGEYDTIAEARAHADLFACENDSDEDWIIGEREYECTFSVNGEDILNKIEEDVRDECGAGFADFEIECTLEQLKNLQDEVNSTIRKWATKHGVRLGVDVIHEVETYTPNRENARG